MEKISLIIHKEAAYLGYMPLLQISHTLAPKGKGYAPPLQQQGSSCGWDSKNGETKVFVVHTEHRKHTEVSQNSNHLPEMLWSLLVASPGGTTAAWSNGASPLVHVCHNILCVHPPEVSSETVMVIQAISRWQPSAFPKAHWSKQEIGVKHGLSYSCSTAQGAANCEHLVLQ